MYIDGGRENEAEIKEESKRKILLVVVDLEY